MGTRNLTIVQLDGEYKVAQYCQWDGYPEGQGKTVLHFLRDYCDLSIFKQKISLIEEANAEYIKDLWTKEGADPISDMVSLDISDKFKKKYPHFHRDRGAKILQMIYDDEVSLIQKDLSFAADSLFCEFAYVIDLDKDRLEVYKGFNEEPLSEDERFAFLTPKEYKGDNKYFPIKLAKSYDLKKLPTDEQFIKDLEEDEELLETTEKAKSLTV